MNIKLLFLFLLTPFIFSQTVTEKLIVSMNNITEVNGFSFDYNKKIGTYFYTSYDTTTKKTTIYDKNGKSKTFSSIFSYFALYDDAGNNYRIANDNITDTTYKYYLLKNLDVVATFDYINENWLMKDGVIHTAAKENNQSALISYNTRTASLYKGKAYGEIFFVDYPEQYEGEPVGSLGFTSDGKPYYVASKNGKKFVVTGDSEGKAYSDIDSYIFTQDNKGDFVYIAKDEGKMYEQKGAFLVQGNKEYKKYDYVYGPVLFNKNNEPVYITGDSSANTYPQRVMVGEKAMKLYSSGVYNLQFTPSGKLAYIATIAVNPTADKYEAMTVIDGKEGKKYRGVYDITFGKDDVPVYVASIQDDKQFVVVGDEEMEAGYTGISNLRMQDNGKIIYVGTIYGNYEKKQRDKSFVHIGDEVYGPYEYMYTLDYATGAFVIFDSKENFGFVDNHLIDYAEYNYEATAYLNAKKLGTFDQIDNFKIFNGKAYFMAGKIISRKTYASKYKLYENSKALTGEYDYISGYEFDGKTGTISFVGQKGKDFYLVEYK